MLVQLDNVLLHNGFTAGQPAQVKLCDFGYSKSMGSNCITACGTPEYMAPEVCSLTLASVWSLSAARRLLEEDHVSGVTVTVCSAAAGFGLPCAALMRV